MKKTEKLTTRTLTERFSPVVGVRPKDARRQMSPIKKNLACFIVIVMLLNVVGSGVIFATDAALPETVDIPSGPAGVIGDGGSNIPKMHSTPQTGAPGISAISDVTLPDETLVITGEGLNDASLKIWAEGELRDVTPFRSDETKMQALVPADMNASTMLVWPVKLGVAGSPIRVNGPVIWWKWPSEVVAGQNETVRIFGKGLKIGEYIPAVYISGEDGTSHKLDIIDLNPYHIEAKLPDEITAGNYQIWVHNGSGGKYGWSNSLMLDIVAGTTLPYDELQTFEVDKYGAAVNDKSDDSAAVIAAIRDASSQGGGIIKFGQGEYTFGQPVVIEGNFENGLFIEGVGMGNYDHKSSLETKDVELRGVSGSYSLVRFDDPKVLPDALFRVASDNVVIRDFTLIQGDDGDYWTDPVTAITINASNALVERVRMIKVDVRALRDVLEGVLEPGGLMLIDAPEPQTENIRNIIVRDSEVHALLRGITMGKRHGTKGVEYIQMKNVRFIGVSPQKFEGSREQLGPAHNAIIALSVDKFICEDNFITSADYENGKLFTRAFLANSSNCINSYVANNTAIDTGPHPSYQGMNGNVGEIILFHGGIPATEGGGLFDVVSAESDSLTVRTDNIALYDDDGERFNMFRMQDNSGSELPSNINHSPKYMLYVFDGKGAGQFRVLKSLEVTVGRGILEITEPFRIIPDSTSRITVFRPFRNNIIYRNEMGLTKPLVHRGFKGAGILFFYDSVNNIVSENTFKNVPLGVALNSAYKGPTGWNLIRDNKLEGMNGSGQGGDTATYHTFFEDGFKNVTTTTLNTWNQDKGWFSLGNIFRSNECANGFAASNIEVCAQGKRVPGLERYNEPDKGMMMTVIENNSFDGVDNGFMIGNPANWSLVRNNNVKFKKGFKEELFLYEHNNGTGNYNLSTDNNIVDIIDKKENPFTDILNHPAKDYIIKMTEKGIMNGKDPTNFDPDSTITRAEFLVSAMKGIGAGAYSSNVKKLDDVDENSWYWGFVQAALDRVVDKSMINDNRFKADEPITREEMASIVVNCRELYEPYIFNRVVDNIHVGDNSFTDSNDISPWAIRYVNIATELKLLEGNKQGSFNPKHNVTRAEAAIVISRLIDKRIIER